MNDLLRPKEAAEILNVSTNTLRRWAKEGRIKEIRSKGLNSHRRYDISNLIKKEENRRKIIYCRVSSYDQKEDLERQIGYLEAKYPDHELIRDIGSGINFKRKGLKTILEYALNNTLEEVVVTYKDRLTRFGYEMFEYLFERASKARIVVLNEKDTSPEQELANDILTITTVFSSKLYGMRKKKNKSKEDQNKED